ncbi:unnamed protein product [Calicophoron daubneyi]|uniref:Protein kinase domain-containing protein n=1 Tax=Calicophoron daubneyi TaxID=300641 RepID=A0AAV2T6Q2_CALDB
MYSWIILRMGRTAEIFFTEQTVYRSLFLECDCVDTPTVSWRWNNQSIRPRKGKYLFDGANLEILDIRYLDAGLYECGTLVPVVPVCTIYNVSVDRPDQHYLNIHRNVIPSNASAEEHDKLYWHPKMKREEQVHYINREEINISAYFYLNSLSLRPLVRWYPNSPEAFLDAASLESSLEPIDCSLLEEAERPLDGTCYRSTCIVPPELARYWIHCSVETDSKGNHTPSHLSALFPLLRNAMDRFLPDPDSLDTQGEDDSYTDLLFGKEFHIEDSFYLDSLKEFLTTPTSATSPEAKTMETIATTVTQRATSFTTPVDSQSLPKLNLSLLELSDHRNFKFFTTSSEVCFGENVTFQCLFPRVATELRLWFLGPGQSPNAPQFIKESHVQDFTLLGQNGRPNREFSQFGDTLIFTLTSIDYRHSGVYICSAHTSYRQLKITVRNCNPPVSRVPLIAVILTPTAAVLLLVVILSIALGNRRKKTVTIVSKLYHPDGSLRGSKQISVVNRVNLLYPTFEVPPVSEKRAFLESQTTGSCGISTFKKKSKVFRPKHSLSSKTSGPYSYGSFLTIKSVEIPRNRVTVMELIGHGKFGAVYRGVLRDDDSTVTNCSNSPLRSERTVAVKTLLNDFTRKQFMALMNELEILKAINPHAHVIGLLGACIQDGPPLILLEYAVHGNLRDFLRSNRPPETRVESPNAQREYWISSLSTDSSTIGPLLLNARTLLSFVTDVADALCHLESLKLVHRDVAARNVLITEGYVAKLSDFGFTSDVSNTSLNSSIQKTLPYRWMAPECFIADCYTSKSEVWSFGILMWEVFALGATPYPSLSNKDIPGWLANGNRNSKPDLATVDLYGLMLNCWSDEPAKRPTFKEVRFILNDLSATCASIGDSGLGNSTTASDSSLKSARYKPMPFVRTCSLPDPNVLPKGYVEMRSDDYLEPRSQLFLSTEISG